MAIDFNVQDNSHDDGDSDENQDDAERHKENVERTLQIVTIMLVILAIPHLITGGLSVILGVVLCSRAPIWLAHTISPIWSGGTVSGIRSY